MKSVSVVIIAKNEERSIARTLNSVQWADETIVVIDSSSKDKTKIISRDLGAKTFTREWNGYANQKNFGISKAKGDWILNIDADEVVTEELAKEIKSLRPDKDGYFIPFRNYLGSQWLKHGGLYPDYHLRLFKKNKGQFRGVAGGQIHESVSVQNSGYLNNPIDHRTYANIADFWKRAVKYSTEEGKELSKIGRRSSPTDLLKVPARFMKIYFWKLGILDGWAGFINALFLTFYQANKLWIIFRTKN